MACVRPNPIKRKEAGGHFVREGNRRTANMMVIANSARNAACAAINF